MWIEKHRHGQAEGSTMSWSTRTQAPFASEPALRKAEINPSDIYSYLDKVCVWLIQPLARLEHTRLQQRCHGLLHVRDKPAKFDWRFCQRLQLNQPTAAAIEILARRNDVHMNYVEVALDWVFDRPDDKDDAVTFLHRHVVKSHHRKQGIRFVVGEHGATRYSGPRRAPNVLADYSDRPSKETGEVDCLHLEWRIRGREALCRSGFVSVRDLLDIDHREFWARRLKMFDIEPAVLGRSYHNWWRKTRRRKLWIIRYPLGNGRFLDYDMDNRAGDIILRGLGSVQEVIDVYGRKFRLSPCLQPISVDHLLPASSADTQYYDHPPNSPRTSPTPCPSGRNTVFTPSRQPHTNHPGQMP
jgi:hypothetical protein